MPTASEMAESPSDSLSDSPLNPNTPTNIPHIPIETVSEEEMALIEAALAAARSPLSSSAIPAVFSQVQSNARSIRSITCLSKRAFSGSNETEIEDLGRFGRTQKKSRAVESYLHRFRRKRGLSVTDITGSEWCEKKMEYDLLFGKKKVNKAMKVGKARHAKLEEEVVQKVKVTVESLEDIWALKFMNFIVGAHQLLFEGLTRELPLIGFVDGVWMVGVIDEIRMPLADTDRNPVLVETKTRVRNTLPSEAQQRNGRLQLMCYKYLWDNSVADNFPVKHLFDFFSLNPYHILSEEIRENTANSGFPAKTLDDIVRCYRNTWSMLPPAHNQLLLRYELQEDNSVLAEDHFTYDRDWLKNQIQVCLEFWQGEREASYVPEEERWKCLYCQYVSACPINTKSDSQPSPSKPRPDSTSSPTTHQQYTKLQKE